MRTTRGRSTSSPAAQAASAAHPADDAKRRGPVAGTRPGTENIRRNEELGRAQAQAQEALDKYTDLFDFAPIGYFQLTADGSIREVNLAGAALLGLNRDQLVSLRFDAFVAPACLPDFAGFRRAVLGSDTKRTCNIQLVTRSQDKCHVQLEGLVLPDRPGREQTWRLSATDVTERRQIEGVQSFLLQCGAQHPGEDFFHALARYLAQSLGMDYVCIDRLEGDGLVARALVFYSDGKVEDNVAYTLKDTPCGAVVGKTICCFPKDVRRLFPRDEVLQGMMAESYVGTTLWSFDGKPIGLIAVIGRKPLVNPRLAESILKLVAVRTAGELERKRAEEAREVAHQRTLTILESIADGFLSLDRQWRVVYINERGAQLAGKSREALLGRSLWESFPEAVGSGFHQACERALAEQVSTSFEAFYPPLNAWFEVHAYPSPEGLSVFYQDTTERKRVEQALRESREDLNHAQAVARVGSWRLNVQRNELLWSDENWRIFGVPTGTPLTYETFLSTVHPDDRECVDQKWQAALRGEPYDIEHRIAVGDTVKWVRERAVLEFDPRGTLLGGFGTTQDITERKRAEEALRDSHARLAQALGVGRQFAFEWICATDEVIRSPDCGSILGLEGEAAVRDTGQGFFQRVHPDDRAQFVTTVQGLTPAVDSYRTKYRLLKPDGDIVVLEETGRATFDAEGRMMRLMGVTADVTERARAERIREEHLARLNTLIQVSNKLLTESTVDGLLQGVVDAARTLTKARLGVAGHGYRDGTFRVGVASRAADKPVCPPGRIFRAERGGVLLELLHSRDSIRYTAEQLEQRPDWWGLPDDHAPLRGLLGARLVGSSGRVGGLVLVSDRESGEFTAEDEALLLQLAALASLALQHLEAREQAERRARELHAVFSAMTDAVMIFNAEGIAVDVNRPVIEAYGFDPTGQPPEEIVRRVAFCGLDGRPVSGAQLPSRRALRGEVVRGEQFTFTNAAGQKRIMVISAAPLLAQDRVTGAVIVWHDVTEREHLLQELTRARDDLEARVEERTRDLKHAVQELRRENQVRRKIEEALAESEERYRRLFESAPLGIVITDRRGTIHAFNRSLCQMLGVSEAQAVRSRICRFYVDRGQQQRLLAEVKRTGKLEDWEALLKRKDRSIFPASLHVDHVQLRNRKLLLTIVQDLTKRKQSEKHVEGVGALLGLFATKASRAEYLDAVVTLLREWCDCQAVGIRLADTQGRLPYAAQKGFSRAFLNEEEAAVWSAAECNCIRVVMGRPGPGDAACTSPHGAFFCNHLSHCLAASCGGSKQFARLPCVRAQFESIAHVPIRFDDRITGSIHLTDRRAGAFPPQTVEFIESVAPLVGEALHRFQVEADLRESEERFRSMFENHAAIMLLVDPESSAIVDANPPAARYYGYSRSQLCSMKIDDLYTQAATFPGGTSPAGTGPSDYLVCPHRVADGSMRTVEVYSSPIDVGGRRLLFSIGHDISERKRLEKRILEISDEERQRIGLDLHDSLGGHLTGLALLGKGLANRLAENGARESQIAEEIVQGVNEAIAQTRAIARGLCPTGLGTLGLASGLEEYAGTVSKLLRVDCRLEIRGQVVIRDESVASHLYRIVQEAVNNAVRHGKAGRVRIRLAQQKDALCLQVRDDGHGLPDQVDKARGMGLRTMRYRAAVLGAQLEIASQAGKGTLISCRLPLEANK